MNSLFRIDVNLFAAMFLFLLFVIAFGKLDRKDRLNRLFLTMSAIVLVLLLVEAATCVINGVEGPTARFFSYFLHMVLFLAAPSLTFYWFLLVHRFTVMEGTKTPYRWFWFIPLSINFLIVLTNPLHGLFFSLTDANVYQRQPLFLVGAIITYLHMIFAYVHVYRSRKRILSDERRLFVLFSVIPILGGIVQIALYPILTMWASTAFSLILMYIFLSERMIQKDGLTQAWTRGSTESYLKRRVLIQPDKPIGVIFFDVDNLKAINDTYGHFEGDQAILSLVGIVRETFEGKAVLSRMGGDEFAVLLEVEDFAELKRGVDAFRANIKKLQPAKPYRTDASVGWGLYGLPDQTFDGFMRQIDKMMYHEKAIKQGIAKENA